MFYCFSILVKDVKLTYLLRLCFRAEIVSLFLFVCFNYVMLSTSICLSDVLIDISFIVIVHTCVLIVCGQYEAEAAYSRVRAEQTHAGRVAKQLRSLLSELEALRRQVGIIFH